MGDCCLHGLEPPQVLEHLVAAGLEGVDAQVERRAIGKRLRLGDPVVPPRLLERRRHPFGDVGTHVIGRPGQRVGGAQPRDFFFGERRRSVCIG